ncbi:MAG: 7-cyano-7-deazaguanine synthase QueC [Cyanobacteria bacterium P01_H01_bin.74]
MKPENFNNLNRQPKAIALLSAGLDSTVSLASCIQTMDVVLAVTVNYGQRAAKQELASAAAIADFYQIPHRVVDLQWLAPLLPTALKQAKSPTDKAPSCDLDLFDVNRVWVPNRNGVLLNVAAAFAESCQARYVIFGANREEGEAFPDNTPAFCEAVSDSLSYSTQNQVEIVAPLQHLSKQEILEHAATLCNVPFQSVWSCYESTIDTSGNSIHCGACASCIRVKNALSNYNRSNTPAVSIAFAS